VAICDSHVDVMLASTGAVYGERRVAFPIAFAATTRT
jgi:hypothetical protein